MKSRYGHVEDWLETKKGTVFKLIRCYTVDEGEEVYKFVYEFAEGYENLFNMYFLDIETARFALMDLVNTFNEGFKR